MDKFSEPSDTLIDAMNSLSGWKRLAEAAETKVEALLAELEAKDKRIAELEAKTSMTMGVGDGSGSLFVHGDYDSIRAAQRIVLENEELRAKMATPVRLPDVLFIKVSGSAVPVMHAERVKERVQAAGFKCVGDEK